MPSNRAIAVNADLEYNLVQLGDERVILAAELVESVAKAVGVEQVEILGSVKGQALELVRFNHPFCDFTVPVILGDHVTTDGGTGLVHTAPDHGLDDFIVGQNIIYQWRVLYRMTVNLFQRLNSSQAKVYLEANPLVVEKLQEVGNLLKVEKIKHSYPHCWRHKTPDYFPCNPTMVYRYGNTRFTPTSIRRNQRCTLDSRLGSSTYRENG